ncbi:spindle assembly abnormal protein 6 homolog [Nematostella vectensis]|uniref:spindle assembly abnormal protein 6 homolog n=1 Tax=Nematostella vectensis TaxID=45351 RepID=UPI002077746C|nr:spindle assembly abnormal protein 6 homolog [Nematostella vectensis]
MDEYFNKAVPLYVKHTDREDRRSHVRITVSSRLSSSSPQKELAVRLTDDGDPFFLYTLVLNEEDFQSLKSQQGLLVDFGAFPQKFVGLLEMCLSEEQKEVPKFLLQFLTSSGALDRGLGCLNIIETNTFKHLTHLSLKFLPGNDTEVKKYLADCLAKLKTEKNSLEQRLSCIEQDLKQRLATCEKAYNDKSEQLSRLQVEFDAKSTELANKHAQEMTAEKERILHQKSKTQQQYEKERRDLEQAHRHTVKQLESRLDKVENQNKEFTGEKYRAEATIRELKGKLSGIEEEYGHMKQELKTLRRDNGTLDSERHERDKTLGHLRTRIAVLEQELRDKEQVISRSNELLESSNDQKKKQEDTLNHRIQEIKKLENTVSTISAEVVKGNEIIHKLQTQLRNFKSEIKLKNVLTKQQEKLLGEKETVIKRQTQELETTTENLKQKEEEVKKLNESLESTMAKLEESKELLKTNENVINWLNKQMNDQMAARQRHGPFELHSAKDPAFARELTASSVPSTTSGSQTFVPRYTGPQQVSYRPPPQRKPSLPRPLSQSTPTIPEEPETAPPKPNTTTPLTRGNRENQPLLDPKYLQRKTQIGGGPLNDANNVPSENRVLQPSQRFGPNPRLTPSQAPLMSAYFKPT